MLEVVREWEEGGDREENFALRLADSVKSKLTAAQKSQLDRETLPDECRINLGRYRLVLQVVALVDMMLLALYIMHMVYNINAHLSAPAVYHLLCVVPLILGFVIIMSILFELSFVGAFVLPDSDIIDHITSLARQADDVA